MDPLVQELLLEPAEPTLLVDRRHGVRFATTSLRRLLDLEDELPPCETVLVAPPVPTGPQGCCWDALDAYLRTGGVAFLPLRRRDGVVMPALARIGVIEAAGSPCFLSVAIRPLDGPDPTAMRLFRAVREGLGEPRAFEAWVAGFFGAEPGLRFLWVDPDRTDDALHLAVRAGLARVGEAAPFDVRVEEGDGVRLGRVFAAAGPAGRKVALVVARGCRVGSELSGILWAAVRVAAEAPAAESSALPALAGHAALTERERQVLDLVARGLTDREIAVELHASPHTVRNHIRHLMEKLGVHRRVRLARLVR